MNISTIVGKYHWGYSGSATTQAPLRPDLQVIMKQRPSGSLLFTAQFPPQEMPRWHHGVIHSSGSTSCLHVGPTSPKCRAYVVHRYTPRVQVGSIAGSWAAFSLWKWRVNLSILQTVTVYCLVLKGCVRNTQENVILLNRDADWFASNFCANMLNTLNVFFFSSAVK